MMKQFRIYVRNLTAVAIVLLLVLSTPVSASSKKSGPRAQWASIICNDFGSMSLAYSLWGVNLIARGMVQDKKVLQGYGFEFGEGPYRMNAIRIDTGRYLVTIQSMSRPHDNRKKEIKLTTEADVVYPIRLPQAAKGEYTWNSTIQYDMGDQLGMVPQAEEKVESCRFVNVRIQDPDKLARFGFTGYKKNDTRCQIVYEGNNQWKLNPDGGILVYENGQWSSQKGVAAPLSASQPQPVQPASAPQQQTPEPQATQPAKKNILVFLPVQASGMTYNQAPIKWEVFRTQVNNSFYYLIRNPEIGTGLIDTVKRKIFDAESAEPLPNGAGMILNMDDATMMSPSGVDLLVDNSKQTVYGWFEKNSLSFTIQDLSKVQVRAQREQKPVEKPRETSLEQEKKIQTPGLLFANSDFEMGDLTNWSATGNAFKFQPTKGDNPTARHRKKMPSKHQGEFWIGTYEKYQGAPEERPGRKQGDRPVGTLTSVPFEITRGRIAFLIGGGKHSEKETVALLIDGKQVFSATGKRNETLQQKVWDVTAYIGKQGRILISDQHPGGWGHINADDFKYLDTK